MVKFIKTHPEFSQLIKDNRLVAVDFTASWCPPCRMIGPVFEKLADEFSNITFVKVDVDENSETAEANAISAMPTFKFFCDGTEDKVLGITGASEAKLKESLTKLSQK